MDLSKTVHIFKDGSTLKGEVPIKVPNDVAQRVLDLLTQFLENKSA